MKLCTTAALFFSAFILIANQGFSQEITNDRKDVLKIGVAFAKNTSEKQSDPVPTLVRKIGELTGKDFELEIYPFKGSLRKLERGEIDVHVAVIYDPRVKLHNMQAVFSSVKLWDVSFVLYTHQDIDVDLEKFSTLKLVTDPAHVDFFDIKLVAKSDLESAIKMVDLKRIDGVIFADVVIDPLIRKHKLKNIRRTFYRHFDVRALISTRGDAEQLDKTFSQAVLKLAKTGALEQITSKWKNTMIGSHSST